MSILPVGTFNWPKPEEFRPIRFLPVDLSLPSDPVQTLTITATWLLPTVRTNHWSINLDTVDNSTNLNMISTSTEQGAGFRGVLLITSTPASSASPKLVSLPVCAKTTVEEVIEAIKANGKERYAFTQMGVGCRFWVKSVVEMLGKLGVVEEKGVEMVREMLQGAWDDEGRRILEDAKLPGGWRGEFY